MNTLGVRKLPSHDSASGAALGGGPKGTIVGHEDAWLFETPGDLLCPITHDLFKDPVINAAGQVYERAAIEHHLGQKGTDPVTNQPLASSQLIPVYTLKSRSYEFREHVAKACVDKAYSTRSCELSVRYLRRAAELVSGLAGLKVPGLSTEVVEFLQSHPSNAFDAIALRMFADGLRNAGYVDQASQLYLRLVEYGEDRAQQGAALRLCLSCFSRDHADTQELDKGVLPFLAQYLETQQTYNASQALELLAEAHVPDQVVLQLCEHLLSRRMHVMDKGVGTAPAGAGGLQVHDLLLQYTLLRFKLLEKEVHSMQPRHLVAGHGHKGTKHDTSPAAGVLVGHEEHADDAHALAGDGSAAAGKGDSNSSHQPHHRLARFIQRRRKPLASGLMMALSLFNGQQLAARVLHAGSVLLLVHAFHQGK